MKTNAEMLPAIQEAILAVLAGQEYSIGDRSFKRADLGELQKLEAYYRGLAAREAGGTAKILVGA